MSIWLVFVLCFYCVIGTYWFVFLVRRNIIIKEFNKLSGGLSSCSPNCVRTFSVPHGRLRLDKVSFLSMENRLLHNENGPALIEYDKDSFIRKISYFMNGVNISYREDYPDKIEVLRNENKLLNPFNPSGENGWRSHKDCIEWYHWSDRFGLDDIELKQSYFPSLDYSHYYVNGKMVSPFDWEDITRSFFIAYERRKRNSDIGAGINL